MLIFYIDPLKAIPLRMISIEKEYKTNIDPKFANISPRSIFTHNNDKMVYSLKNENLISLSFTFTVF